MLETSVKLEALKMACETALLDFDAVIAECRTGVNQFFETPNGVGVTSVSTCGAEKLCFVVLVAGNMEGVAEVWAAVEAFARDVGCTRVRTIGRPGFAKVYTKIDPGFSAIGTLYEKAL